MSIKDLCNNIKRSNIQVIRVPEGEEKEMEAEELFALNNLDLTYFSHIIFYSL